MGNTNRNLPSPHYGHSLSGWGNICSPAGWLVARFFPTTEPEYGRWVIQVSWPFPPPFKPITKYQTNTISDLTLIPHNQAIIYKNHIDCWKTTFTTYQDPKGKYRRDVSKVASSTSSTSILSRKAANWVSTQLVSCINRLLIFTAVWTIPWVQTMECKKYSRVLKVYELVDIYLNRNIMFTMQYIILHRWITYILGFIHIVDWRRWIYKYW